MKCTSSDLPEENFDSLLQKFLLDPNLIFELLRHNEFLVRGFLICCWLVKRTKNDPRELFADAYLKALASKDKLHAENTPNVDAFFGWFTQLALNILRDQWRKSNREHARFTSLTVFDEESSTEADRQIVDVKAATGADELLRKFLEFTNTLPLQYRYALILRLKNYPHKGAPYQEIPEQMNRMGIKCTSASVCLWVKAGVEAFLNGTGVVSERKAVSG